MNEKLSALMDGELDRAEALAVIRQLGQDTEQRSDWDCYHLIGDVLRGESIDAVERRRSSAESIFAKLADEPTVLAPAAIAKTATPPVQKRTRVALAMAASVLTVSAIGVVAFKQQSAFDGGSQVAKASNPAASVIAPVAAAPSVPNEVNLRVNDYLVVHRQFASNNGLRPASVKPTDAAPQAVGK
jgi:sigma-E factor negative regulatory protein RseA